MNVKHGFSTLNRLLGKKNKDKNLSKSSTNLSISPTYIDTSHLQQQNRILPLPIATSNAPFEQTFRITVLLPRDQLYVARLGAKIKLDKLLELVCENKLLLAENYEFRHPTDSSQVFGMDLTVGSVGLSEIRLCHKSESYDNFNSDEIVKLRNQTIGRESLSSSEFSSKNSKHILKTPSPYSSTNSLNSIDSTGMNTNYMATISLPIVSTIPNKPPIAPTRKKRMAPRPPSQNSIPEKEILSSYNSLQRHSIDKKIDEENVTFKKPLPRKEFHVSTPNLNHTNGLSTLQSSDFHRSNISIDYNGNSQTSQKNYNHSISQDDYENLKNQSITTTTPNKIRPISMYENGVNHDDHDESNNDEKRLSNSDRSSYGSVQNLTTSTTTITSINGFKMPEPSPRKIIKKKTTAPAPPPRNILPPAVTPRVTLTNGKNDIQEDHPIQQPEGFNISTTILNQSEPSSPVLTPPSIKPPPIPPVANAFDNSEESLKKSANSSYIESKQSDSGIGDVPSENLSSINDDIDSQTNFTLSSKSPEPISSDEEEQIKIYNLNLGKTVTKPLPANHHEAIHDLTLLSVENVETTKQDKTKTSTVTPTITETERISASSSPTWTYTIPAPPNFADDNSINESAHSESSSTESASCEHDNKNIKILNNSEDTVNNLKYNKNDSKKEKIVMKSTKVNTILSENIEINEVHKEEDSTVISSDIEDGYHGNKVENVVKENGSIKDTIEETISIDEKVIEKNEEIVTDFVKEKSPKTIEIVNTKSEIINELNNAITQNNINSIIKKSDESDEDIESAAPNNLSNFKISTYSPPNSPIKTLPEAEQHQNQESTDEPIRRNSQTSNDSNDEKIYRKRTSLTLATQNIPSITIAKARRNIGRSDSFHTTRHSQNFESFEFNNNATTFNGGSRSSSFLSLLAAQKQEMKMHSLNGSQNFIDTNNKKSSSELSIGESPSLQSLIIMKTILNTRKNSFSNEIDNDKISGLDNSNNLKKTCNCDSIDKPKNNLNQEIKKIENNENKSTDFESDKGEITKKWKYQGPPSINLSTWSERPKVNGAVTIKNEGDYIFGGINTKNTTSISTMQRNNYRNSMQPEMKSLPAQKYQNTISQESEKLPIVRSVEYKKPNNSSNEDNDQQVILRSTNTQSVAGNTMTLGRLTKTNRHTIVGGNFVPNVKGFATIKPENGINITTWKSNTNLTNNNFTTTKNVQLKTENKIPKSEITINRSNTFKSKTFEKEETIPAFANIVLRKTGIKEKMISSETDKTKEPSKKSLITDEKQNNVKLELKLKSEKVQPIENGSIIIVNNTNPPPPPPIIRSVVTKQNSNNISTNTQDDSRDQLLSAIRSFNKNSLNQS